MKKRILIITAAAATVLIAIWAGAAVLFKQESSGSEPTELRIAVSVAQPTTEAVFEEIGYLGSIEGAADAELSFRIGGTIAAVFVGEGDVVRRGDALAALDQPEMKARLDRARAELANAEANLSHWKSELEIDERLLAKGAVSRSRRDQTKLAYENAGRARSAAAASVDEAAGAASAAVLRAPHSGVVGHVERTSGETVMPGQPVVRINAGERRVRVDVLEHDIAKGVTSGTETLVDTRSCGQVAGRVIQLDTAVRGPFRSVRTYVDAPPSCLRDEPAGATIPVTFRIGYQEDATIVPAAAIDLRTGSPRVFRVAKDERAEPVAVELGLRQGTTQQVHGDLGPGDLVVVSGATNIEAGDRLRVIADITEAEGAVR